MEIPVFARERLLMLVGGPLRFFLAQNGFGENASDEVFVIWARPVEMSVAAMEAFQHLKRSTMFPKPVACCGNTFLSEVASRRKRLLPCDLQCRSQFTSLRQNMCSSCICVIYVFQDVLQRHRQVWRME